MVPIFNNEKFNDQIVTNSTLRFIILDNLYVRYSFNTFHVLNPLVSFDVEAMLTEV